MKPNKAKKEAVYKSLKRHDMEREALRNLRMERERNANLTEKLEILKTDLINQKVETERNKKLLIDYIDGKRARRNLVVKIFDNSLSYTIDNGAVYISDNMINVSAVTHDKDDIIADCQIFIGAAPVYSGIKPSIFRNMINIITICGSNFNELPLTVSTSARYDIVADTNKQVVYIKRDNALLAAILYCNSFDTLKNIFKLRAPGVDWFVSYLNDYYDTISIITNKKIVSDDCRDDHSGTAPARKTVKQQIEDFFEAYRVD